MLNNKKPLKMDRFEKKKKKKKKQLFSCLFFSTTLFMRMYKGCFQGTVVQN